MAKISPVSIKYLIRARFSAGGTIEKPDVIGAIFGQTEGLLGEELELRKLQKEGKIGRIDVELEIKSGNTIGIIEIPSSLDKAETTIVAAALETIERIGPSEAKIEIERIEDVRSSKREYIIERARKLLEGIEGSAKSNEIESAVISARRAAILQEYGKEMLPAGNIEGNEIIVVEGRADVINLLKHGITNVIGMNGTVVPKTIKELSKTKKITIFVDGDRGGMLIAKDVIKNANITAVAIAPEGKEVEELNEKEILSSLRKAIPAEEFKEKREAKEEKTEKEEKEEKEKKEEKKKEGERRGITQEERKIFSSLLYDLVGTRGAYIIDNNLNVLRKVPLFELSTALKMFRSKIYALIIDGTCEAETIRLAEKTSCKYIIARNFAAYETKINLVAL